MGAGVCVHGTIFPTEGLASARIQGGREPSSKFKAQHRGLYAEITAGSGREEEGFKFPCYG